MSTRFSKNELHFGRLRVFRSPVVPRMDEGRNGDVALIDQGEHEKDPTSVGWWIKIPFGDTRSPVGTVVTGIPGATSSFATITINAIEVTFSFPDNIDNIVADINIAEIPNIRAVVAGSAVQLINYNSEEITVSENSLGLYSLPELAQLNTTGVWLPFMIHIRSDGAAQIFIETPDEKTYPIFDGAVFPFTLKSITVKTLSGSIDIAVQLNNVSIPGLSQTITSTKTTYLPASNVYVTVGDTLTIETTNNNTAIDLTILIAYKY